MRNTDAVPIKTCCEQAADFRVVQKEKMQILFKIIISLIVIVAATAIGKRLPFAAGLIGVMPLTGALVPVWIYIVLIASFAVWLGTAIVHQWMLK